MDRRGTSVLLIPLIAAMALLYPTSARKTSSQSEQIRNFPQGQFRPTSLNGEQQEWHGGRDAVQQFFFPSGQESAGWPKEGGDPRANAAVRFLIASVPDPIDSGLPHAFDRFIGAIQAAAQAQPYFLADFDLPWEDCLSKRNDQTSGQEEGAAEIELRRDKSGDVTVVRTVKDHCSERRFVNVPGFLLFSCLATRKGTKAGQIFFSFIS